MPKLEAYNKKWLKFLANYIQNTCFYAWKPAEEGQEVGTQGEEGFLALARARQDPHSLEEGVLFEVAFAAALVCTDLVFVPATALDLVDLI